MNWPSTQHLTPLAAIATAPIVYGIVQPGESVTVGVPFVQTRDIGSVLDPTHLDKTTEKIASAYDRSSLIAGDILIALRGEIGSSALVPGSLTGANISRGVARLRVSAQYDPHFVHQVLSSAHVRREIDSLSRGSALREISIGALRSVTIPTPSLPEQRKIAEILRVWDNTIERLQHLRRSKSVNHRALVTRLVGAGGDAHSTPLARIVRPITTKNTIGEERVLTSSSARGLVDQRTYFSKGIASVDTSSYYLIERGDFAYNRSSSSNAPFGAIRRLEAHARGVISTLYLCFRPMSDDACSPEFLDHLFRSGYLDKQLGLITHEGARSHGLLNISKADFFELTVPLPSLSRQRMIAAALDESTAELTLLDRKIELLRTQKRGLMQRLLTGDIRVPVEEELP